MVIEAGKLKSASEAHLACPQTWDDGTLVEAIRARNTDAFAELVRRYSAAMYSSAWRILGERTLAEDAVQEAFFKFWRKPSWRTDGAALSSWLYGMTLNVAIDMTRHRRRELKLSTPLEDDGVYLEAASKASTVREPDELNTQDELNNTVHTVLRQLPDRQQRVLVLCYFEQLSHQEAAVALKTTAKAVESLALRARRKMKSLLAQRGIGVDDL